MAVTQEKYRYRQIAQILRTDVANNHRVGDLLPSELELADRFSVAHKTIRQALNVLVDEGLIRRYYGRGTIVCDRLLTGEFAIVLHPESFRADSSPYWRLAVIGLTEALRRRNPRFRIKIHLGEFPEHFEDLLEPDVLKRLRAVFTFADMNSVDESLRKAAVPVVSLSSESQYLVNFDYLSLADLALQRLQRSGCRRVGILCGSFTQESMAWRIDECIRQKATALGIWIHPEWIPHHQDKYITERSGMELFKEFWKVPDHPEAVIVVDDVLCRGALRAMQEMGIDSPRDIKIVTQANRGVELPFHKAISRVEFNAESQVQLAVEMMMDLLAGREPKQSRILLPGEYVEGETI